MFRSDDGSDDGSDGDDGDESGDAGDDTGRGSLAQDVPQRSGDPSAGRGSRRG